MSVNWNDPEDQAIDGFTVGEIEDMVHEGVATARCQFCGQGHQVEPDAENYDCQSCGKKHAVTSPLVKLGFI